MPSWCFFLPYPKGSDQCFCLWASNHHSLPCSARWPSSLDSGRKARVRPRPVGQACLPVCGKVDGLTPVPLGSIQAGSHRGSPLLCWSSRNCMGSWKMSTHSRRGTHWRTGRMRTLRGRRTCNSPRCCSRKQSHRHSDWSIHSHLLTQSKKSG